jgi:hypothetical protein
MTFETRATWTQAKAETKKKCKVADSRGAKEPNKSSGLHEKAILLQTIDWRQLAFIQTASRCRLIYMAVLLPRRTFSNSKLPVREKVKAMKQIIHLLAARHRRNKSPAGVSLNLLAGELFHNRGRRRRQTPCVRDAGSSATIRSKRCELLLMRRAPHSHRDAISGARRCSRCNLGILFFISARRLPFAE